MRLLRHDENVKVLGPNLDEYTRQYEQMGVLQTKDGILVHDWNRRSHPLQKEVDMADIYSTLLPHGAIPHGSRIKLVLVVPNPERNVSHPEQLESQALVLDRIPPHIRYVTHAVRDVSISQAFDAIFWNPPNPYIFQHDSPDPPAAPRIYEAHVRRSVGIASDEPTIATYKHFTEFVIPRIKKLGYNTIQLYGIIEHAYYASFGYQITNYFAPSSRFGTPEDLKELIGMAAVSAPVNAKYTAHGQGLRVVLDVVHSHSSTNVLDGLNAFNNTPGCFFHEDPAPHGRHHPVWQTRLFDYGRLEVRRFLLCNLRYWVREFRFDGFRFDAVTSMLFRHHGVGIEFGREEDYYTDVDDDGVAYLMLANHIMHELHPKIITIAEDVSGMPLLCRPVKEGGIGFDFRFAMGVPPMWLKLVTEKDEDWDIEWMAFELTNRRKNERTISYVECHDECIVGKKALAFTLMDAEMYTHMSVFNKWTPVIDRGIALHKMIRLATFALAGEGYLNFIGNEFGHPEWIDFPRKGNNYSFHYARRQFKLADDSNLRYSKLRDFDVAMHELDDRFGLLKSEHAQVIVADNSDKILAFERGPLLFVFNFHPKKSHSDYKIKVSLPGRYQSVLNTDDRRFDGHGRVKSEGGMTRTTFTRVRRGSGHGVRIGTVPARTGIVLARTPSGVVVFGRHLPLAGDDLLLPAVLSVLLHLPWIALIAAAASSVRSSCEVNTAATAYFLLTSVLVGCCFISEVAIAILSLRGTVADPSPRRHLRYWVPAHAVFVSLDLVSQLLGLSVVIGPLQVRLECPSTATPLVLMHACVAFGLLSQLLWYIAVAQILLLSSPVQFSTLQAKDGWDRWIRFFCLGHSSSLSPRAVALMRARSDSGDDNLLRDVARLFVDLFSDAEGVVSDVFVGLLYVRYMQRKRVKVEHSEFTANENDAVSSTYSSPTRATGKTFVQTLQPSAFGMTLPVSAETNHELLAVNTNIPMSVLSPANRLGWTRRPQHPRNSRVVMDAEMREIIHFSQYAEAIYGLPLHMITNWSNFTRTLNILCLPKWCQPQRRMGEAAVETVVENVRNHLGKPGWPFCCVAEHAPRERHSDLIAISLENGLYRSPYMVCLDREFRKIVVAVRGTLSTADVLVDLKCSLAPILVPQYTVADNGQIMQAPPIESKTHAGMLQTAQNIKNDIAGLLESLIADSQSMYRDYEIVVVGHSLGAGVAALLSHLLLTTQLSESGAGVNPVNLPVKCLAYSPPGSIATPLSNSTHFSRFTTSIVLGDDTVPRLNRRSVEQLKRRVSLGVKSCKARKVDIVGGFIGAECFGVRNRGVDYEEIFGIGAFDGNRDVEEGLQDEAPFFAEDVDERADDEMQLPGRVIHFKKVKVPVTNEEYHNGYARVMNRQSVDAESGSEEPHSARAMSTEPLRQERTGLRSHELATAQRKMKRMYRAVWSSPEEFREIVVSSTMVSEHMPNVMGRVLRESLANFEETVGDSAFVADVAFRKS
ncbi:alpha-1,4-glucan branching enzyme [Entophlyctis luteolus]|nr:alpha-1,4-glucan branching enzyme [Entophlyctis luteolus]